MTGGRWPLVLWATVALACAPTGSRKAGQACAQDADCGSGFDCYREQCVHVCSGDEQCPANTRCVRHRCLKAGAGVVSDPAPVDPAASAVPSELPDVTAEELRAIRTELEQIRRTQAEILQRLPQGAQGSEPVAAPP